MHPRQLFRLPITRASVGAVGLLVLLTLLWFQSTFPTVRGSLPLQLQWSTDVGAKVESLAATDQGLAIVQTRKAVVALDVQTGQILWQQPIPSAFYSEPAVSYAGGVAVASPDSVWLLDAGTGQTLWSVPLESDSIARVLAVSDCCVLINRLALDLTVYDRTDGSVKWVVPTGRGFGTAYFHGDEVYVLHDSIVAYEAVTGRILWKEGDSTIGDSDFQNGVLYFGSSGRVRAFNVQPRQWLWNASPGDVGLAEIVSAGDFVFVGGLDHLYALDAQTGAPIWKKRLDKGHALSISGDVLYVIDDFAQKVVALQLATGQELGSIQFGLPTILAVQYHNLAVANNFLLVGHGNTVYGIDQTGRSTSPATKQPLPKSDYNRAHSSAAPPPGATLISIGDLP